RTASFWTRDIHHSHYGRICPIDTSVGINVGLIGSLAIHARIGHRGSLESPFYEISERSTEGIQEERVVPAGSVFPFQYFCIGTSFMPFIEHNDTNRALMSSTIQRQAVTLSQPEKCIVGTGLK
ncbi:RNA polymerase beta subunit (chloroplast), partial [Olea europaea subsp. europaea]